MPFKCNPPYVASRGGSLDELQRFCWFSGPSFFKADLPATQVTTYSIPESDVEVRGVRIFLLQQTPTNNLLIPCRNVLVHIILGIGNHSSHHPLMAW